MAARLVVLYGIGGLSDVGRHAILAALEQPTVEHITVITEYPELLDEENWECNCQGGHTNPSKDHASKINVVKIDSWQNQQDNLSQHFQGCTGVVSCLGHRQPGVKYPQLIERGLVAAAASQQVIQAMKEAEVKRVVAMSSMGMGENIHWAGKLMKIFFWTNTRKAYKDLQEMEKLYHASDLDYLLIRPTGLGEEVVPVGEYFTQDKKGVDVVGLELARWTVPATWSKKHCIQRGVTLA
ncbi:Demethylmenaquinone methyltransferase [Seminavis robusta]|uniref:Demethylmenaquinone methyltransferase n=1 Tax=Seminavis robusta TaxID=568900 RepID=A0A9N8H4M3_9STRA|nr:Demethylmenaquinone methyltransferase [Seminavis robusta]|eukprot:Sro67_g037390.1 Demethylmenaquinone methyltransferase (239) ;mRNA; f:21-737